MPTFQSSMMKRALTLARRGIGKTSPNPAVGCVIVRDGEVVGEGWHRKAGTPHAEIHALRQAGERAAGAEVYVTLEPCAHYGKTPPCAEALIAAGVGAVYVGMIDPNPLVSGKGIALLQKAGIAVTSGFFERECRRLNEGFIKHVTTGRPFVILKSAMTLDGKTATESGDSKWVTCDKSRAYVHRLRATVDAVMVGVGTVAADDPLLTCRIGGGRDPLRVIIDSTLKIPRHAQVLGIKSTARTVVATTAADEARMAAVRAEGADVLLCRDRNGRVDLTDLLDQLGKMGIQSVLLEGGATVAGEAVRSGLVDKFLLFYAPKLVAGAGVGLFSGSGVELMEQAYGVKELAIRRLGNDILIEGYPEAACLPV